MIGLIAKDFLVFKIRFNWIYRIMSVIILMGVLIFFPNQGIHWIAILLPVTGIAFLTELINVEEKSDWKDYLPVLPIKSYEIVLSRYIFCGVLLAAFAVLSFVLCVAASLLGGFAMESIMADYMLGILFSILMLCFGIPSGYFFNNQISTGTMMGACVLFGIFHNTGAEAAFLHLGTPTVLLILATATTLMILTSYLIALWIYSLKLCEKRKLSQRKSYNRIIN